MSTYSFLDIQGTLVGPGGIISLGSASGASEEGITVTQTEDKNTMSIGADGSVMHSLHGGKSGQISISLLKTSPMNALLSLMYNLQIISSVNHGQNTFSIADLSRGDAILARYVAFRRQSEVGYRKVGGNNIWLFDAGIIDIAHGPGVPDVNLANSPTIAGLTI
ncbi:MAG: DUF3277 family protein [Rhodospirillaceae bacterium]|nr:MAG: DUF3277 family protein [Rhodospirillaceae bacterium]